MAPISMLTLGPECSYSEIAARKYIRENSLEAEIKTLVPANKTEGVIEELIKQYQLGNHSVKAIVPLYNTKEGRVKETMAPYRGLIKYHQISKICDEYWMEIVHCIASKSGLKNIRKVLSHPQALSQCSNYIESNKLEVVPVESTSVAAKIVSEGESKEIAAICSEEAAKLYGLDILEKDIGNKHDENSKNVTRFVVLDYKDHENPTGKDKTTITCEFKNADKPGVLHKATGILRRINLSMVESMPKGSMIEYVFWLDVDEHRKNMPLELEKLNKLTKWLYIHGSYPRRL
jgi:prephenate dehydratase